MSTSPTKNKRKELSFPDAIQEVINGKKVTKTDWNNPNIYIFLKDERLKIHLTDEKDHDLIVSEQDLLGIDWETI